MYKSFTILELIITILILSIIISLAIPKQKTAKLGLAKEQLILHLKYTRYIAMLDNKYKHKNIDETKPWHKARWTLKFYNCNSNVGGLYYIIFSDKDGSGTKPKKIETLKDPLTNKYIYATGACSKDNIIDKLEQVKVTQYFGVSKIEMSCNDTSSIGQLSFSSDGNVYTKFETYNKDAYKLEEQCNIKLYDKNNKHKTIYIEPKTGYIH